MIDADNLRIEPLNHDHALIVDLRQRPSPAWAETRVGMAGASIAPTPKRGSVARPVRPRDRTRSAPEERGAAQAILQTWTSIRRPARVMQHRTACVSLQHWNRMAPSFDIDFRLEIDRYNAILSAMASKTPLILLNKIDTTTTVLYLDVWKTALKLPGTTNLKCVIIIARHSLSGQFTVSVRPFSRPVVVISPAVTA
jgi:hypothetical protein